MVNVIRNSDLNSTGIDGHRDIRMNLINSFANLFGGRKVAVSQAKCYKSLVADIFYICCYFLFFYYSTIGDPPDCRVVLGDCSLFSCYRPASRRDTTLSYRINLTIKTFQRSWKKHTTLKTLGIAYCRDINIKVRAFTVKRPKFGCNYNYGNIAAGQVRRTKNYAGVSQNISQHLT